jgi:hypothetical protein
MSNQTPSPKPHVPPQTKDGGGLNDATCCASFTPGPWKADGYHVRQSGRRGTRMIADVCYTGPHHTPPDEYPKSCRLADEANARLIAAAPELLEAMMAIEERYIDGCDTYEDWKFMGDTARAALHFLHNDPRQATASIKL